ncbi:MAG: thioredoxin family protein [candidate division WOR-3 bacterium]|nr:thioredoxin family protein [candidate division WOR-3 bacterium]MCX7757645.1 thioredoxin family protein [candidate division WOR-3 bacterium]MDW7987447.1 thioredoxin family protein [candidate division WOR-3 bacterium]
MKLLLFGKESCEVCKNIKEKLEHYSNKYQPIEIIYYDVETVDGLTECAYRSVPDIPTVILIDEEKEIRRWVQSAPTFAELDELLKPK